MFGIGGQELILILLVALIVLGPKKLPDIAKTLGKAIGQFQRASNDLRKEFETTSESNHPSHSPRYPEEVVQKREAENASQEAAPEQKSPYNPDEIEGP
ncbi:MAG: twin-arginine translocase TatA/TatE family subunit [Desulfomonilia bacterium]|nr:twin-arginine translocase TatA/TatE family subunit [Desulfomonilia bacterium]